MSYDKDEIKENLTIEQILLFCEDFGASPIITTFGIKMKTICHNNYGEGSFKLYYYDNTKLFKCFTDCDEQFFDIFELYRKIAKNQHNQDITLGESLFFIGRYFGFIYKDSDENNNAFVNTVKDSEIFHRYQKIREAVAHKKENRELSIQTYDKRILTKLLYPRIIIWENEGIDQLVIKEAQIGYYPIDEQITIPHYDKENRFIGLRGRALITTDAEKKGKYRPVFINGVSYRHPLGSSLYNLNLAQKDIKLFKKVIVFEGEKSCLLYKSLFDSDISVCTCGFNITDVQVNLLIKSGAEEIIIAFDRQFEEIGDRDFIKLKNKLIAIHDKYSKYVRISFIFDSKKITSFKSSPIDEGKESFLKLFNNRIIL